MGTNLAVSNLLPSSRQGTIFLSASIPDSDVWHGEFDPLEITDAVVALTRTFLTAGFRLVTAAHPTIAPLLLYVAAEMPDLDDGRVLIYQSRLFDRDLPEATRRFERDRIGRLIWTEAADGDLPVRGHWQESLRIMRLQMFEETLPWAAMFIGGMSGIREEYDLFHEIYPGRPAYALGLPGGEARALAGRAPAEVASALADGTVYPAIWRLVLAHLLSLE